MGYGRKLRRLINGVPTSKNFVNVLADLLSDFYEYLSQENKPSDEDVRDRFVSDKDKWFKYCDYNKLTDNEKDLFVLNVEKMWNHNKKQA